MTIKEFRKLLQGTDPSAELVFQYAGCLFCIDNIIEQNAVVGDDRDAKRVVVVPLAYVREADDE